MKCFTDEISLLYQITILIRIFLLLDPRLNCRHLFMALHLAPSQ